MRVQSVSGLLELGGSLQKVAERRECTKRHADFGGNWGGLGVYGETHRDQETRTPELEGFPAVDREQHVSAATAEGASG